MDSFSYDSLDAPGEIRILTLYPGSKHSDIEASLSVRTNVLEEPIWPYEAVSYFWGDQTQQSTIKVLQQGSVYEISVGKNLKGALRALRYPRRKRYLWVDALCIDQRNILERNHQVLLMSKIYESAEQVCVWLGEKSTDSSLAIEFASRVIELEHTDSLVEDPTTTKKWAALSAMMRRQWFSRRWIIQELALARSAVIYCGTDQLDWSTFAFAIALFVSRENEIGALFGKSEEHGNYSRYLGEPHTLGANLLAEATTSLFRRNWRGDIVNRRRSLESLICSLTTFEAMDPRDTIYAILSLASDVQLQPPSQSPRTRDSPFEVQSSGSDRDAEEAVVFPGIDYSKSVLEIYTDFIKFAVGQSHSLDILCRPWAPAPVSAEDGTILKMPSWITGLHGCPFQTRGDGQSERVNADCLAGPSETSHSHTNITYGASGSRKASIEFGDSNSGIIFVDGLVIDVVGCKEDTAIAGNIPQGWPRFGGWKDESVVPPEEFWRTLVANRHRDSKDPPPCYPQTCMYAFQQRAKGADLITSDIIGNQTSSHVSDFLRRVQAVIWNRRLLRTRTHRFLGLGPKRTKKGDLVCVLFGCSVPVILRRIPKTATPALKRRDSSGDLSDCKVVGGETVQRKRIKMGGSVGLPIAKSGKEGQKETGLTMQIVSRTNSIHTEASNSRLDPHFYYELIGECYIHGLMDGEGLELGKAEQTFELR
jgi:hypothetical protein